MLLQRMPPARAATFYQQLLLPIRPACKSSPCRRGLSAWSQYAALDCVETLCTGTLPLSRLVALCRSQLDDLAQRQRQPALLVLDSQDSLRR